MARATSALTAALCVLDDVWHEARALPPLVVERGLQVDRLPQISELESKRIGVLGRSLLTRIDAIATAELPDDLARTLAVARSRADCWARADQYYWHLIDCEGNGWFGMFAPTAYCGGMLLGYIDAMLANFAFAQRGDFFRYLGLAQDYARLIGQMRLRTAGQAELDIVMPIPQIVQSVALFKRLRASAAGSVLVDPLRYAALEPGNFADDLMAVFETSVLNEFDKLLALLESDEYRAAAPAGVGMSQYDGGAAIYADLVRLSTTLDLTPQQVHDLGLARMARNTARMDHIMAEGGFRGSPAEYLAMVADDPAWRAEGSGPIKAFFKRYIDRIAPHLPTLFHALPPAGHTVDALPAALSGSMTFGYYGPPSSRQPEGTYFFNSENLSRSALLNIASLTYHELCPGHHLHFNMQLTDETLHPLRRYSSVNAFNEGWAEYSVTLAEEIGMFTAPQELFGRLMMDSFLTTRLVVDTGMNALGWTLEEARDYMRANSYMLESEVCSESLRYACDIPAQALGYKIGDEFILGLRETMRQRLGNRFDLRDFHTAVLAGGALPLPILQAAVESATDRLMADAA